MHAIHVQFFVRIAIITHRIRRGGRYAGRLRLAVVENRTAKELTSFVRNTVESGVMIVTDDWASYDKLEQHGYAHLQVAEKKGGF